MFKFAFFVFIFASLNAWSKPVYVGELASAFPGNQILNTTKCQTCHNNGRSLNAFGSDFGQLKRVGLERIEMFRQLGALDSDKDGRTNLEELLSGLNPGKADPKKEIECPSGCQCLDQGFKVTYCVDAATSTNKDILYYFHGSGGEATNWRDPFFYTEQIRQVWKEKGVDQPTVVAVSFDFSPLIEDPKIKQQFKNKWILTDQDPNNKLSGLLPYLMTSLIPKIESGATFARRIVVGESMGGFNSLQVALKTNLFNKAAVICAPLAETLNPFSTWEQVEAYAKNTIAWNYYSYTADGPKVIRERVEGMQFLSQVFASSIESWSSADPFQLLKAADVKNLPQFYITAGAYDPYLAYEGSAQFSNLLKAKGGSVEWRPQWGGHCAIDILSLAEFLVKP